MLRATRTSTKEARLLRLRWVAATLLGLLLLASHAAQAQIAFRSAASSSAIAPDFRDSTSSNTSISFVGAGAQAASASAGSITPALPAGTAANDFAVLVVAGLPTDTAEPGAPAGWTLRSSNLLEAGANDLKIMTFYRLLAGGDANPSITLPASWVGAAAGMSGQIAVWRGVDTTTPFDVADVTSSLTPASSQWTPPGITTVTGGAMVVSAVATNDLNNVSFQQGEDEAASFIRRMTGSSYDTALGGRHAIGVGDKVQSTPGAVTMLQWEQNSNGPDVWVGITFALRPTPARLVIDVPSTSQNDVMIASVAVQPSTTTITAPAGWTLVRRIDNAAATTNSLAIYRRVAGASEPSNYVWDLSGASYAVGGMQSFLNVDTATPIDVENGAATSSSTSHATPSVTTTVTNTMIVAAHTYASSRTWTKPAGMTESIDRRTGATGASGQSLDGSYAQQAAAGATGAKTASTSGDADAGNTHILALRSPNPLLTINKPAGTVANDVMIAAIGVQPSTTTITPPAGWTLLRRMDNSPSESNTNSLAIYMLVAGGAEPASYTWPLSGFVHAVGGIQSFSGVDTTTPINVENGQTTASGTSHATQSVSTTVANTMLVTSHTYASSRTWTPPAGMTEAFDVASLTVSNSSGQSMEGNYVTQAASGATGTKTATVGGSSDIGNTHILALQPAGGAATPGSFNAFETSTAASAVTGVIKTKIAGSAFSLDVVAISGGAQMNSFSGNVKLELLANTGTVGSGYGADNCPTANSVVQTIASAAIASGRSTVNFSAVANVYRDVRVRISYPTASPTVTICSTDSFANRPSMFTNVSVTDNDAQTAGTARTLNNITFTAGAVMHNAGRNFTVSADAVNAAGTPAVTTNYTGAPTISLATCGASAPCTSSFGTLTLNTTFTSGQLVSNVATYSQVGSFTLQLVDSSFASIDNGDGSTSVERTIQSSAINVGRFVPDHFAVTLNTPAFSTGCAGGGYTYVGQAFSYATQPVISVTAQDASNNTTTLYTGSWWRISNASLTGKSYVALAGTLDISGLPATDPVVVDTGGGSSGSGTLTFGSGSGLLFTRTSATVPFNAEIGLSINVIDADGITYASNPASFGSATAGNGIAFSNGKEQRFGRLRLQNAIGSQLLDLPIPMETQYWTTNGFVTNTNDSCTAITAANIGLGKTTTGQTLAATTASVPAGNFSAGKKTITLSKPGTSGAADLVVNLGSTTTIDSNNTCLSWLPTVPTPTGANLSYLRGLWCGANSDRYPSARATFGTYKGTDHFIFERENY